LKLAGNLKLEIKSVYEDAFIGFLEYDNWVLAVEGNSLLQTFDNARSELQKLLKQ